MRFLPDNLTLKYLKLRKFGYALSIILVLASIALTATKRLNFGIDLVGGVLLEARFDPPRDIAEMRQQLSRLDLGQVTLQQGGAADDILIRIQQQAGGDEANQQAIQKVRGVLGEQGVEYLRTEIVGPQVGGELKRTSALAGLLSILGILAYIAFRFDWQYGVAMVITLVHDIILTVGFFALTRHDFDLTTVAAILLISGYSLNDTVVVFDRVRENLRKYRKMPLKDLIDLSLNETLYRTMMTSGTTALVLLSLYLFGGEVIRSFSVALLFGIAVGTYSSVFVAAPLLLNFNLRRDKSN